MACIIDKSKIYTDICECIKQKQIELSIRYNENKRKRNINSSRQLLISQIPLFDSDSILIDVRLNNGIYGSDCVESKIIKLKKIPLIQIDKYLTNILTKMIKLCEQQEDFHIEMSRWEHSD